MKTKTEPTVVERLQISSLLDLQSQHNAKRRVLFQLPRFLKACYRHTKKYRPLDLKNRRPSAVRSENHRHSKWIEGLAEPNFQFGGHQVRSHIHILLPKRLPFLPHPFLRPLYFLLEILET